MARSAARKGRAPGSRGGAGALPLDDPSWLALDRGLCPPELTAPELVRAIERHAGGDRIEDPWTSVY